MTRKHVFATLFGALALQACCAAPASGPASGPHGRPPEPPAEAFTACAGKTEGAAVTVTMPDGKTMAATCAKVGDKLAARPNDAPPRR